MRLNPFRVLAVGLVALVLLSGACSAGFIAGRLAPSQENQGISYLDNLDLGRLQTGPVDQGGTPDDQKDLFKPFWETWDIVHEDYVDQPVDNEQLMRGAIRGMLGSLGDQHTSYLDPSQYEQSTSFLQGEYEGIGAFVDVTGDYLTIVSPMKGSPAESAGLQSGDKVIAVDGEDVTGIDGEIVRQKILGPAGTSLTLTIQREGVQEPFDVEITRASITVPSVESEMLDDDIAYVRLINFGDNTTQELQQALKNLNAQNPQGLILDLRNNGGGFLQTAIDVASEFVDSGVVMYEAYGDGTQTTYEADSGGLATDIPLVVLINQGTASASEIVAGAVQDYDRGLLVGETSFGKGSVQSVTALPNDQGAVRITIARWLTPDERQINSVGLEPDVRVTISEEDIQNQLDPQLDRAIQLLTQ
jgi:carboxyl-terminal processing protease